ncbi:MAG: helix-turn-helix domain-containing protein [Pseudobdellovibrionaceae bacterium]
METSRYNYYDILEVSPHCQQHEVTSAYEKAKSTYSGENPAIYTIFSEEEARDLLKLVEEAYQVLGNKSLRALYDEKLGQSGFNREELSFEALKAQSKTQMPEPPKKPLGKIEFKVDEAFEKEIKEQSSWTGEFIKKVREYKNIPLERLSETTKISAYYINSIEKMDAKSLPAPVFVRGYVAQISKVLGLDEKKVCESYMKNFKDSLEK